MIISKLWYIGQIYTIPKYQKGNWKKNIQFPLEQVEIQPPRHLAQLSIWRGRLGILDKLNYINKKWIQSLLNPTNALWKDLILYWLKLILNSDKDLTLFRQKQILTDLLVTKIYKNRTMKISLFNYSMLGYISPITTSLPHIYRRNSCPTHIFKPTHQTWLQASSHPGIFQTNLPLFGTFVDFYNQV